MTKEDSILLQREIKVYKRLIEIYTTIDNGGKYVGIFYSRNKYTMCSNYKTLITIIKAVTLGICTLINSEFDLDIIQLPELYKYKPRNRYYGIYGGNKYTGEYWWKPSNIKTRLKYINKALNDARNKLNN